MIDGTWKVRVTSGPWWFRALKLNRKRIEDGRGYNIIAGCWEWGVFVVAEYRDEIVLKYTDLSIIDRVHYVQADKLIGRFYKKGKYIGDFTMERIK